MEEHLNVLSAAGELCLMTQEMSQTAKISQGPAEACGSTVSSIPLPNCKAPVLEPLSSCLLSTVLLTPLERSSFDTKWNRCVINNLRNGVDQTATINKTNILMKLDCINSYDISDKALMGSEMETVYVLF
jgi:hypothetical protein